MDDVSNPSPVSESGRGRLPVSTSSPPTDKVSSIPSIFGVIHLVYVCLGCIGVLLGVTAHIGLKIYINSLEKSFESARDVFEAFDFLIDCIILDVALGLVLSVVLLVAGIGLLVRKSWALRLSIYWAMLRIVIFLGMALLTLKPQRITNEALSQGELAERFAGDEQLQQLAGGSVNIMEMIIVCLYPVILIIFLRKQRVIDSLH